MSKKTAVAERISFLKLEIDRLRRACADHASTELIRERQLKEMERQRNDARAQCSAAVNENFGLKRDIADAHASLTRVHEALVIATLRGR